LAPVKAISGRGKFIINLFASILVFTTNAAVNFLLTPYIVHAIGVEANGFVQLAANFTQYISLITIAVSSMSGRFITIAIAKGDKEKAISFYSSIFWAYLLLFGAMFIPFAAATAKLDSLIHIPERLVSEVKVLFGFGFVNFIAVNIVSFWNISFFVSDNLYLQYIGKASTELIKVLLIISLFSMFTPRIWYMTAAQLIVVPVSVLWGIWNKKRVCPDLKVINTLFSFGRLKEIVASGVWRSVQSAGEMLLTGLDLLICNLFIGSPEMGILALSKTVPMLVANLNAQIVSSFAPKLTIDYAKTQKESIAHDLRRSFKILAVVGTIPLGCLIVFGSEFFSLWVPGQDAGKLQILSVLTCFQVALLAGIQPISNIFSTVNKAKPQALSVLISGVINVVIVLAALRFIEYGVYIVAGTSSIIALARNLIYTIPASAAYLGFQRKQFYIGVLFSAICISVVLIVGVIVKLMLIPDNWARWILSCCITAGLSLAANARLILSERERETLLSLLSGLMRGKL
jgi:O-antigen/teichoic acid export membrane protein